MPMLIIIGIIILFFFGWVGVGAVVFLEIKEFVEWIIKKRKGKKPKWQKLN
ncbi:hypothetical protein [Spiroplasma endosymbiont of Nebria brevicollis]|uniref:hypothetical protein n=1 Tax=Spiroplasma endosymbiont of Nebria brevicollis TaxID=3066284 RepID=UPI00313BD7BC